MQPKAKKPHPLIFKTVRQELPSVVQEILKDRDKVISDLLHEGWEIIDISYPSDLLRIITLVKPVKKH